ncbi:DUF4091 domain-containing protein [Microlunatus panaciterrae]|uniref:Glycoside hydrolase 123 catalytic domain-containing protein n=1 Tax=Microlunatus panaciterrae TaxID=400768 RepID=A0ABS2RK14_9ACTN|nr:DUF4091 domain-containing protein [Microlunatus panaciterrae]MBM7798832.1 hypothetical protein [Microlunatus panaciterrae]
MAVFSNRGGPSPAVPAVRRSGGPLGFCPGPGHYALEHIITNGWQFVTVDSLEKVFADSTPRPLNARIAASVFLGEVFSFQVAFRPPDSARVPADAVQLSIDGPAARFVSISSVDLVPCTLVAFPGHDDGYLRDAPGLYPDLLRPAPDGRVEPIVGHWRSAWFDVCVPSAEDAGDLELRVRASVPGTGETLYEDVVRLRVIGETLPELDLVNTHWFHADGLADHYGDEVFSERHWSTIDAFVGSAARMDINSLLTPVWTPPVDTAVGARRTPVQLVDITVDGGDYDFDFKKLDRWLEVCRRHGISYLEMPHLFTQWGARATPAIDGVQDGKLTQLFGWEVPATDPRYREFLVQLLPRLKAFLAERWGLDRVLFHLSDEPHGAEHADSYRAARTVVADLLVDCTVIDALSDFEFYRSGLVSNPVVATDAVQPFLDAGVPNLWVYFCVGQDRDVANRFIGLPSARLRVLGHQLFAHEAGGFLHWGFNFYNSARSTRRIDPFVDTCAGGAFPAGDAFIVYPGPDRTPWESIRHRVAAQAMADHRALQLLRERAGRERALEIIDPDGTLSYSHFPLDPDFYRAAREQVNTEIEQRPATAERAHSAGQQR